MTFDDRNIAREYAYFLRHSPPHYIANNLPDMPQNKGYIVNGIVYFGQLPPAAGQPTVLFEKCPNKIMYVHEYTDTHYNMYLCEQQKPRKLVHSERRRVLSVDLSLNLGQRAGIDRPAHVPRRAAVRHAHDPAAAATPADKKVVVGGGGGGHDRPRGGGRGGARRPRVPPTSNWVQK
jgi:hypothetical protein